MYKNLLLAIWLSKNSSFFKYMVNIQRIYPIWLLYRIRKLKAWYCSGFTVKSIISNVSWCWLKKKFHFYVFTVFLFLSLKIAIPDDTLLVRVYSSSVKTTKNQDVNPLSNCHHLKFSKMLLNRYWILSGFFFIYSRFLTNVDVR